MNAIQTKPMKILHTEASCGWGGQEIRILEESKALRARGYEIVLACPSYSKIYEAALKLGFETHAIELDKKKWRTVKAMRALLLSVRPDVVNTHSSSDSWITAVARIGLVPNPAVVRTRHISAPVSKNAVTRWLYRKGADHVVTTGESLRETLIADLSLDPSTLTSVPTGIDPERFSPRDKAQAKQAIGRDPSVNILGIVATLRSWKGHADLIDAWASLCPDFPDWHLMIVGDGPQAENIDQQVKALGLGARVSCMGQQQRPEDYLAAMDVFCLPSYANEGVPQAILQAMLSGLAIVTTPVGAILEAVSDQQTALVVAPRVVPAIADALRTLMSQPQRRAELGAAARAKALEKFTLASMADKMERIFIQSLCPRHLQVINVTRIGDTLLATPAIAAIAARWPKAQLSVLGHPNRYEVLEHFPGATEVGAIEKKRARWMNLLGTKRVDMAIVFGFDLPLVQYALRTARRVVAFAQQDERVNAHLWRAVPSNDFHAEHAVEHALCLSQSVQAPLAASSKRLVLKLTQGELNAASNTLRTPGVTGPLIGFQMVSFPTKAYRDWPKESFLALAQALLARHPGAHFYILGGGDDTVTTNWLASQLGNKATELAGKLSLRQTAGVIAQLNLYVGVDTGPTHIAGSLDIPMVALYHSKSPSWRYGPIDRPRAILIDHPNAKTQPSEQDAMSAISVQAVTQAALSLLE